MRPRAVLLDMGGVLLDMGNERGLPLDRLDYRGRTALAAELARRGARVRLRDLDRLLFAPWQRDYARRYELGREAPWGPHLKRLRRHCGSRLHDLTLLGAWFRPYADTVTPIAGACETLDQLAAMGLALAVVSNVPLPGRLYQRLLRRHGLDRHLHPLYFSYDAGSRKPSPAMLRRALTELAVEPAQAVMVGDRRASDVAAGRAAGTATVWVESAHASGPPPDAAIATITELPALLRRWA